MTDIPILTQLPFWHLAPHVQKTSVNPHDLNTLWSFRTNLPQWITDSPTIMRCWELLASLDWAHLPKRNLRRDWGQSTIAYAAFIAAELIRRNEPLPTPERLHRFLVEHPGFIGLRGFPRVPAPETDLGFNPRVSLPTPRHFTYRLRAMPHVVPQFLLADSVRLIRAELRRLKAPSVDCVSLDTKHIIAWDKANNPKAYGSERYNKQYPPLADPDCRLGCKRKHNRITPTINPRSASAVSVGEYYWGYGSGLVVTKIPGWGEFILAKMTQPFDPGDATYFFPLMTQVQHRLGYRPRYDTFDAAFDAWYVYAYFYRENQPDYGFAAVPFSEKGGYTVRQRQFDAQGWPLCKVGLAMPLQFTYTDRTTCLVEHERGKYVCPLRFPQVTSQRCPVRHPNAKKQGCVAMIPISIGARLRYTLDRESETYQQLYDQRTAVERINSQAVALGIERPHLRNGLAIANEDTLIYLLINLRFLQRLRAGPTTDD